MKSARFYLEHVGEQTAYLLSVSEGLTKERFLADRTLLLAFERSLEIIGEAVAKLDEAFKEAHPDVPWRKIRALRNIVAHVYWEVDYDIIWDVVCCEIPTLQEQVNTLLQNL